jgi:hypothetical protein
MAKNNQKEDRPLWVKEKGGGTFRLPNGYRVKPQEKFRAYEHEVPQAFRDNIRKIEETPEEVQEKQKEEQVKEEAQQDKFQVLHRGGPWYDVKTTADGKPMNDTALYYESAVQLKEKLENGEEPEQDNQEGKTEEA